MAKEGIAFLDRVAALRASRAAGRAFDRILKSSVPVGDPAWSARLYQLLAERLLRWFGLSASPGAAYWEWAPLFRLEREVDPHYFGQREVAERLGACPPMTPEVQGELAQILARYLAWRRQGLGRREELPVLGAAEVLRWSGLFPTRFAWASLEILRAAGLYPLGSAGAWRAWRRFAQGEFAPEPTAAALREWVGACEAGAPAVPAAAQRREFAAAAFAGEWGAFGLSGPCGDLPDCPTCPLRAECAWACEERRPSRGAAEALASVRTEGAAALPTERLLQAIFSLPPEQAEAWRARLEQTPLRALAGRSLPDLAQWLGDQGLDGHEPGAERLHALFELARRYSEERLIPGATFRGAEDVFRHFRMRLRDSRQEQFFLLLLDSRRRFLGEVAVSQGTMERALVHPRDVFGAAVRERAGAVVIVHNHPSGDPTPSPEDINVTRRLREAGALIGIPLLDHVILGEGRWLSLAERGLLKDL
jgi:DNA repair protein RadC